MTMFSVQIFLILLVSRSEYGSFSLTMSYVTMGQALLTSLFGSPLITILGGINDDDFSSTVKKVLSVQILCAVCISVLATLCSLMLHVNVGISLIILAAGAFVSLSYRDAQRVAWAVEYKFDLSVKNTGQYLFYTVAVLVSLWLINGFHSSAQQAFLAIFLGSLLVNVGHIVRLTRDSSSSTISIGPKLATFAAWSIPGAIVIWVQNNLYLTLVAKNVSISAVAELSASRMVIMPFLLASSGLLRLVQVRYGNKLKLGLFSEIRWELRLWLIINIFVGTALALLFATIDLYFGQQRIFSKYPHLLYLASFWIAFAGIMLARSFVTTLLQAMGAFKSIFLINIVSAPTAVLGLLVLIPRLGLSGAIISLMAAEAQLLAMAYFLLFRINPSLVVRQPEGATITS